MKASELLPQLRSVLRAAKRARAETLALLFKHHFERSGQVSFAVRALIVCKNDEIEGPEWAWLALCQALNRMAGDEVESWDEAFREPRRTARSKAVLRRRVDLGPEVYRKTRGLQRERPTDALLFDDVGREFGICGRLAADLYYRHRESGAVELAAFWNKLREVDAQIARLAVALGQLQRNAEVAAKTARRLMS
jgi:hypothetical protein